MFMRRSIVVMLLSVATMGISGCAMLRQAVQRPEVTFRKFTLESVNFHQASFNVIFDIQNPNSFRVPVESYQYTVKIGDHTILAADALAELSVPASGTGTLSVPLTLVFADVTAAVERLTDTEIWPYTIDGSIDIDAGPLSGISVPFTYHGEIPRPVMPKIDIRSVNIRSVSFLNFEADVVMRVENTGSFQYILDTFTGAMELNGRKLVTIDELTDNITIGPGVQEITLPVRLSAENLVQALLSLVSEQQVQYRLIGDAVVRNETFGTLPMSIDTGGSVPVINE